MLNSDPSTVLDARYKLLELLGEGGMGQVFRAYDRLSGQAVALKKVVPLWSDAYDTQADSISSAQLALASEFRTLATLRHPHVIGVLDYGFDLEQQPFYTMVLLDQAVTLRDAALAQPLATKITYLIQMFQALTYLHRRQIIHRDLKPGNVLVADQQVKVLDFGLAVLKSQSQDGASAGTLAYMAPELFMGGVASEQSDLYSAGVLSFEILVGQRPFEDDSITALIDAIMYNTPDFGKAELALPLRGVLERLLAKQPEDRYVSAEQVIAALCQAVGMPVPPETTDIRESFLQASDLIGREPELAQLSEQLEHMLDGVGSVQLIGGESGVGKSRLVDELRIRGLVKGVLVLRGQEIAEGRNAYQGWRNVLRRLALSVPLSMLEMSILKMLVPDPGALLMQDIPDAPEVEPPAAQERLIATVEAIFRRVPTPLLIILEDLHWAGAESLALLTRLQKLTALQPLLILGTYRDDERPELPSLLPGAALIKLKRLDPTAIAQLSMLMLGEAGRSPALVKYLETQTEGNIFFLVEIVRVLAEQAGQLGRIGNIELPRMTSSGGIQRIVQTRLERIPSADRRLLLWAAIIGREVDARLLHALDTNFDYERWLTTCVNAAVLEVQDMKSRFAHDKFRETLLTEAVADQQALHQQVGEALETVYADDPAHIPALAYHWSQAKVVPKAVNYLTKAHIQAVSNGLMNDAVSYALDAIQLLGISFPRTSPEIGAAIGAEMGTIQQLLAGRALLDLKTMPAVNNPDLINTIGLVLQFQPAMSMNLQQDLFALMALKNFSLTLQNGNTPFSAVVYVLYAMVYRLMTGDAKTAYELGQIGLGLLDSPGQLLESYVVFVFNHFLNHWVSPVETSLELSLRGSNTGLAQGDILFGCFNTAAYVIFLRASGAPLDSVIEAGVRHGQLIAKRVANAAYHCLHETQYARALAGKTAKRLSFSDETYDHERDLGSVVRTENLTQVGYYFSSLLRLNYYYRNYAQAVQFGEQAQPYLPSFEGQIEQSEWLFFHTLALIAHAAELTNVPREEALQSARQKLSTLQGWAAFSAANFGYKVLLVEAELARAEGRQADAVRLYDEAIATAEQYKYRHHAALAQERAGMYHLEIGDTQRAKALISDAYTGYLWWNAHAKVDDLKARFSAILS